MRISLIVAYASNRVIGKDNDLVWRLPDDMKYFSQMTKGHHVIMGRKNWNSIPPKYQPLPNRTNIILTRNRDFSLDLDGVIILHDLDSALAYCKAQGEEEVFIIGGAQVYREGIPHCDRMYITEVKGYPEGDTFFPEWDKSDWKEVSRSSHDKDDRHDYAFDFVVYDRKH